MTALTVPAPAHRVRALAAATAASALLAIFGPSLLGLPWLLHVFKPLTTVLVIVYAWPRGADAPAMRRWVLAGLALSLVGDVALLWPQQGFLPGLVAFLLAHLAYVMAFTRDTRLAARWWPFAAYAAVAGGILAGLWPSVPAALKGPVLAYVVFLASMAAQALVRWRTRPQDAGARTGALGAALFVASDACLAFDRFHAPLPAAALLILGSYWLAQWCIASSLRGARTA